MAELVSRKEREELARWAWLYAGAYTAFLWFAPADVGGAWIVVAASKVLLWILLLSSTVHVFGALGHGRLSARRAWLGWSGAMVLVVGALIVARGHLSPWFDDPTWRVIQGEYRAFPHDHPLADQEAIAMHDSWRARWGVGAIQGLEVLFVVLLAGSMALIGKRFGRTGLAGALAAVAYPVIVLSWSLGLGTLILTYDRLHLGVISGALAVDLICCLYPPRPEGALAGLLHTSILIANAGFLRSVQKTGRPAREKLARGARDSVESGS